MHEPMARPSSSRLWIGMLLPPLAWLVDLQTRYALVPYACTHGAEWLLLIVMCFTATLSLLGAFSGWRGRAVAFEKTPRVAFMSMSAILLGIFFAVVILSSTIPHIYLGACD